LQRRARLDRMTALGALTEQVRLREEVVVGFPESLHLRPFAMDFIDLNRANVDLLIALAASFRSNLAGRHAWANVVGGHARFATEYLRRVPA